MVQTDEFITVEIQTTGVQTPLLVLDKTQHTHVACGA